MTDTTIAGTDPRDALRGVLLANHDLAEENIDQAQYDGVNAAFVAAAGQHAADRLAEICTAERWSPDDMAQAADDDDELTNLWDRIKGAGKGAPTEVVAEALAAAERLGAGGVDVRELESDLPGFRYFELIGKVDVCAACGAAEGEMHGCSLEERSTLATPLAMREHRVGGRLVLTVAGGRSVTLDEQETADVMWALANGTRRNRKAVRRGNNPEREARFARQQALMAKIVAAPEG